MSLMLEALDQRRPEEAAAAAPALQPPPPPIGAPEHALAGGYAAAWSPSAETPPRWYTPIKRLMSPTGAACGWLRPLC